MTTTTVNAALTIGENVVASGTLIVKLVAIDPLAQTATVETGYGESTVPLDTLTTHTEPVVD